MANTERQLRFGFMVKASNALTWADRQTLDLLRRLAKGFDEVWHKTKTIAARLGIGLRAAEERLRKLIEKGLLERVPDSTLTSGRRLRFCAPGSADFALRGVPPLHSPIYVSDDKSSSSGLTTGGERGETASDEPTTTTILHSTRPETHREASVVPPTVETQGKASSDEVAKVVAKAQALFPGLEDVREKVVTLARLECRGEMARKRRFAGLEWVKVALARAEYHRAREWVWVDRAVKSWLESGHPGYPPGKPEPVRQNFNPPAPREAAAEEQPPTEEDLSLWRRLARGPGGMAAMAKKQLERWGGAA